MFRAIVSRNAKISLKYSASIQQRCFADILSIPTDAEQQTGRRKEELDAEARGSVILWML